MAIVTYYKNPMALGDREVREYKLPINIMDVLKDFEAGENNFQVNINGKVPDEIKQDRLLMVDDIVTISIAFAGGSGQANTQGKVTGALTALLGVALVATGFGAAAGFGLIGVGVLGFVNAVINRIPENSSAIRRDAEQRDVSASPVYSLNAAGNQTRAFQPLPLCLSGRGMRFYPDFGSNPYNGYNFGERDLEAECKWGAPEYIKINFFDIFTPNTGPVGVPNPAIWNTTVRFYQPLGTGDYAVGVPALHGQWTSNFQNTDITSQWVQSNTFEGQVNNIPPSDFKFEARFLPDGVNVKRMEAFGFVEFVDVDGSDRILTVDDWELYGRAITHNADPANANNQIEIPEVTDQVPGGPPACFECQELLADAANSFQDRTVQRVYHVFNYGFGDLDIQDHRIINTDVNDNNDTLTNNETFFRKSKITEPIRTPTSWLLESPPPLPQVWDPKLNYEERFDSGYSPFTNVMTIEGGRLTNARVEYEGTVLGPTTDVGLGDQTAHNWMFREGPEHTLFFEVDLEFTLFELNPLNGLMGDSATIEIQYRDRNIAGAWSEFTPNINICANSNRLERCTVRSPQLPEAQYEVRIRLMSKDPLYEYKTQDIAVSAIRFFRADDAVYIGENRVGLDITSDAQINGNIGRYSGYVRNKCWVYDGNGGYAWDYSSNPADLYLYYARGGFYNTSANGSFAFPFSPTIGWVNSADHPDSGERMWGCGLQEKRIDLESIQEWWQFCEDQNLYFDHYYSANKSCFDVLTEIAAAGRASPSWANGSLGVVFEDPNDPIVAAYGMFNIRKDTFSISYNHDTLVDEVIGQYLDRDDEWISREVKALLPTAENGVNESRLDLIGITDCVNAQREVNLLAARQYYQRRTITFDTDLEGFCNIRGDVIGIQHDMAQWEYSARLTSVTIEDGMITSAELMCNIGKPVSNMVVRLPCGDLIDLEATAVGNVATITGEWPASQGPFSINQGFDENLDSEFENSCPEDFLVFVGQTATPFKRARITEIDTVDMNTVRIIAVDEDPAIYAREFDNLPKNNPAMLPFLDENQDHIRPCATIDNGCFQITDTGAKISWESDGAIGAEVFVSVNGSPEYQLMGDAGFTVFGSCADILTAPGDQVVVRIEPVAAGPYDSNGTTVEFTHE